MMYVAMVAAYIEVMNSRANGRLPNREYRNNNPAEGVVKWRVEALPSDEVSLANSRLRDFVSSFGLLQYLAAPLLILLAVVFSTVSRNPVSWIWASGPLGVGLGACALMWHRAYFGSLGW